MSSLIPLSSYNLALEPFNPTPALEEDFPVTIRITLAALDPEAIDEKAEPSTLRILKKSNLFGDGSDSEDESEEEEEEEEEKPTKKIQSKKDSKKSKKDDKLVDDSAEESENDDEDSEEDGSDVEDDEEIEEFVLCTLGPKIQYQQTIDLTITPDEEVYFVVTGSYPIHLTGNYVEHPYDEDESDESDEDYDGDSDEDYDLTPDEDEIISDGGDYEIDDLDDVDDVEGKIEEIVEEEEEKKKNKKEVKSPKKDKKRAAEPVEEPVEEPKKSKKAKKEKTVEFSKDLEQGPTGKKEAASNEKKRFPTKTLAGGLVIEDRTVGKGQAAKSGNKVGVRYIGKLKNGKVFDKNTSGKPFVFGLGKGEVIKGWDVGVAGMAIGGERRIIVPASMAYGKKALPGIPANSELTFDVKLVSLK